MATFTKKLSSDVEIQYGTVDRPFMSGTFVPETAECDVHIEFNAFVAGRASAVGQFVYGIVTPDGDWEKLRTAALNLPLAPGVSNELLGGFGYADAAWQLSRDLHLSGLTPDDTYTWAIQFFIIGSSEQIELAAADDPVAIKEVTREPIAAPTLSKTYVACFSSDKVKVIRNGGRQLGSLLDQKWTHDLLGEIAVGDGPLRMAVTPNASRLLVLNNNAKTVSVIDTATDTVVGTSGVTTPAVRDIVAPTDTTAYITTASGYYPLTIATATLGAVVLSGTAFTAGVAASPDGLHLYGGDASALGPTWPIRKVQLSSGTVVATANLLLPPNRIVVNPANGDVFVGTFGAPGNVYRIDESDMSVDQTIPGPGNNVVGLAIAGEALFVVSSTGVMESWGIRSPTFTPKIDNAGAVGGVAPEIAVTSDAYIYISRFDSDDVFHIPAGGLQCRPSGGPLGSPFALGEFAEVTFVGATETP